MVENKTKYTNQVHVFEHSIPLENFLKNCGKQLEEQFPTCTIVAMHNFENDHHLTVQALEELRSSASFIALTTAEGARGVDMKNPNIAHVEMNYMPTNVAEAL